MPSFTTSAELEIHVDYEDGQDGPEILGYTFVSLPTKAQAAIILDEIKAHLAKLTAAAQLEQAISRREG